MKGRRGGSEGEEGREGRGVGEEENEKMGKEELGGKKEER